MVKTCGIYNPNRETQQGYMDVEFFNYQSLNSLLTNWMIKKMKNVDLTDQHSFLHITIWFKDQSSSFPSSWRLPDRDTIRKDSSAYQGP